MVHHVEKKKLLFSKAPNDERNLADIHLALYDDVIVFDHVEKVLFLMGHHCLFIYIYIMFVCIMTTPLSATFHA